MRLFFALALLLSLILPFSAFADNPTPEQVRQGLRNAIQTLPSMYQERANVRLSRASDQELQTYGTAAVNGTLTRDQAYEVLDLNAAEKLIADVAITDDMFSQMVSNAGGYINGTLQPYTPSAAAAGAQAGTAQGGGKSGCESANGGQIRLSVGIPFITTQTQAVNEKGEPINCYYLNGDLTDYIAGLYYFLLSISGFVAMVMVMIAGAQWVFAAGDAGKITKAKERIGNAVVGIVILLFSYTMLYMVNPQLLELKRVEVKKVGTVKIGVANSLAENESIRVALRTQIQNLSSNSPDRARLQSALNDIIHISSLQGREVVTAEERTRAEADMRDLLEIVELQGPDFNAGVPGPNLQLLTQAARNARIILDSLPRE